MALRDDAPNVKALAGMFLILSRLADILDKVVDRRRPRSWVMSVYSVTNIQPNSPASSYSLNSVSIVLMKSTNRLQVSLLTALPFFVWNSIHSSKCLEVN